jgi:hypothetical protein
LSADSQPETFGSHDCNRNCEVEKGSSAESAGLRAEDVVLELTGISVQDLTIAHRGKRVLIRATIIDQKKIPDQNKANII